MNTKDITVRLNKIAVGIPSQEEELGRLLLKLRARDKQNPIRTFKFTIESYEKGTKRKISVTAPTLLDAFFKVKPGVYTNIFDKGYNYYKNSPEFEELQNEVYWRKNEKNFINWVEDHNGDGADIITVEENNNVIIGDGFSDDDHQY